MLAQLELVGTLKNEVAIYLIENEDEVSSDKAIRKIHEILNQKSKEQMQYSFRLKFLPFSLNSSLSSS